MQSMRKIVSGVSSMLDLNSATLSGALDVIVIRHHDGSLHSTPFHVRFGKLKIFKCNQQVIDLLVNGQAVEVKMKLGKAGQAYFIEQTQEEVSEDLLATPIHIPIELEIPVEPLILEQSDLEKEVEEMLPKSPDTIMQEIEQPQSRWSWFWGKIPKQEDPPEVKNGIFGRFFGIFKRKEDQLPIEMSLCGHLLDGSEDLDFVFRENRVKYEEWRERPWDIMNDQSLVLKIEQKLYNWEQAMPILISQLVFGRPFYENQLEGTQEFLQQEIQKLQQEKQPFQAPLDIVIEQNLIQEEKQLPQKKNSLFLNVQQTKQTKKYKKVLRLSSQLLEKLHLQPGINTVVYRISSSGQRQKSLEGKIYLWNYKDKIVISDIDGTITRSDALGQIFPMIGKDWSHKGVVSLYHQIYQNGYKILYLSSRAIGQVSSTKGYLSNLNQNNQLLPEGPVIVSPDRLFKSFYREVIKRRPQEFKASVLREIAGLFPHDRSPFYAGFGNRDTDSIAYRAAGVALQKIFIINSDGNIVVINHTYNKSYPELKSLVQEMFPSLEGEGASDPEYSNLFYWKPQISRNILEDLE